MTTSRICRSKSSSVAARLCDATTNNGSGVVITGGTGSFGGIMARHLLASGCPDVVYAFGHGHVGLTAGAATARLVADMISGKHSSIGAAPYSASRF